LKLPDYKPSFPRWKGIPLNEYTQNMDDMALDLLNGMMALDPNKRISARMALMHPYFDTLNKSKFPFGN
jgi:serine/threonine protein kinase